MGFEADDDFIAANQRRIRAGEPFLQDVSGLLGKGRVQFVFRQQGNGARDRTRDRTRDRIR